MPGYPRSVNCNKTASMIEDDGDDDDDDDDDDDGDDNKDDDVDDGDDEDDDDGKYMSTETTIMKTMMVAKRQTFLRK